MAHIYVSHFVVMPSVTKVADVAWFMGSRGPVIIIVPYVGSRGPNFCFIFIIVFILLVTNVAGIAWGTEALINAYIYVSFYLVGIKSSKSSRLYEDG